MIRLIDVIKTYPMKSGGELRALDHVSLHVEQGEWLAIMGPSGSGKSTLVNLLGCLDAPTAGKVILDDQDLADVPASQRNRIRAEKIGFVFQQFHLIAYLTALENVMLAQYFHSMTDEKEALAALHRVGLRDRARHLPSQLSGGEQQRVCVARALINDPKLILADEPTGNLDAVNAWITLAPAVPAHVPLLLADAQTSGGLLIAVPADRAVQLQAALQARGTPAAVIGRLTPDHPGTIVVLP